MVAYHECCTKFAYYLITYVVYYKHLQPSFNANQKRQRQQSNTTLLPQSILFYACIFKASSVLIASLFALNNNEPSN